jgi:hypothetical protein
MALAAVALTACLDENTSETDQELTQAISVPVGDPIALVAAPYVSVAAHVGDTLNFTATGPACATGCSYTWRNPDAGLARYGGVILGYGSTLTTTASTAGNSRVTLNYCVQTSARFSRCIYTYVYITTTL